MTRYIVLYQAPESVADRFARATPDEAQAGMQAWATWAAKIGPALLDPGAPLSNAVTITSSGRTSGKSAILGMSILQADSMDGALRLVEGHHHLEWADSCEITVLEEMAIPELAT